MYMRVSAHTSPWTDWLLLSPVWNARLRQCSVSMSMHHDSRFRIIPEDIQGDVLGDEWIYMIGLPLDPSRNRAFMPGLTSLVTPRVWNARNDVNAEVRILFWNAHGFACVMTSGVPRIHPYMYLSAVEWWAGVCPSRSLSRRNRSGTYIGHSHFHTVPTFVWTFNILILILDVDFFPLEFWFSAWIFRIFHWIHFYTMRGCSPCFLFSPLLGAHVQWKLIFPHFIIGIGFEIATWGLIHTDIHCGDLGLDKSEKSDSGTD